MKKWLLRTVVVSLTILSTLFNSISAQPPGGKIPEVWVELPDIPLLKRHYHNRLLCVRIFAPEGNVTSVEGISAKINRAGLENFDQLLVYGNLAEPQPDTSSVLNTVKVSTALSEAIIPVGVSLRQGWNYIWLGAVLKDNADLNSRPSVQVLGLKSGNNTTMKVSKTIGNPEKRVGISVRKPGDDQVHTYRIPGIVSTDKGTLVAVYDNRYDNSKDLPANIDVGMSRSTDGGRSWEQMKVIMDMGEPHGQNGIGDPTILFDPATKKLWVAALWSKGNRSIAGSEPGLSPEESGQLILVSSDDDGKTWSKPYNITSQVKNPIWHICFNGPGNGIVMKDGTLVFPAQYWDESAKPGISYSSVMYSKDHGKTWHMGTGFKSRTTESQVVETTPGTLMLNMRDQRGFYRSVATSTDLGRTWVEHPTSYHTLPDPICMASLIKASVRVGGIMKEVLFFSNVNNSSFEHGRKDMTIKASLDLGETWMPANELLIDERYGYGYSSLVQLDEHTIGLLYEGLSELNFVRIPVKEIIK